MLASPPTDDGPPRTQFRWAVLFGVWLIYFGFGIGIASMAPLVEPIAAELSLSNTQMGAILGAWPFVYIIAAIPCGMLLDRFGAGPMLLAASIIMACSLVARSAADTPLQMLLAVALFGIGGPMISVGAPTTITSLFTGQRRALAMGIYVTGPYLGGIIAMGLTHSLVLPAVGGDWRDAMLLYAALLAISGLIWLAIYMRAKAFGTEGTAKSAKKYNLGAFAEILRLREVQLILVMSVGIFFINHALNNWLPQILVHKGWTPVTAGYWAAIPSLMGVIGVLVIPKFATPNRRLAVMAALFCAAFLASVALHADNQFTVAAGLVLQGLARGSMMTLAILILMETPNVPEERLGLAGGMFFTTAEIGGVLGPLSFGFLSDVFDGFALPLVSVSVVSLGLLATLAALKRTTQHPSDV